MSHEKDEMATRPLVWGTAISFLILVLAWAVPTAMEGWLEANWARPRPISKKARKVKLDRECSNQLAATRNIYKSTESTSLKIR